MHTHRLDCACADDLLPYYAHTYAHTCTHMHTHAHTHIGRRLSSAISRNGWTVLVMDHSNLSLVEKHKQV